jgi:queuine tRNA-ribosyltransferase
MTDSGGFQVLSLAFSNKNKIGKFMTGSRKNGAVLKRDKIKITPKGVYFKQEYGPPSLPTSPRGYEGHRKLRRVKQFLGPELSMKIQSKIGADMVFAFDQITSPLDSYSYNKKAVAMTDRWAKVCLKTKDPQQALFGIVQGGLFKDLRIKSAKSIGSMPFDGFGIGGSYTKKQIAKV